MRLQCAQERERESDSLLVINKDERDILRRYKVTRVIWATSKQTKYLDKGIPLQLQELHDFIVDKVDDIKAQDIVSLDVRGKSSITDFMVVCTGTSNRHVASIADHVNKESKLISYPPFGISGEDDAEWVIVDMGSVMLHIMQKDARDLYQLEKLWG